MLPTLTKEQQQANIIKARAASQAAKLRRQENLSWLKTDYLDMPHWQQLATQYKVRMPLAGVPVNVKEIRKALKKCGISVDTFNEHYTSMKYFVENNSKWSAQAIMGLVLEMKHENS